VHCLFNLLCVFFWPSPPPSNLDQMARSHQSIIPCCTGLQPIGYRVGEEIEEPVESRFHLPGQITECQIRRSQKVFVSQSLWIPISLCTIFLTYSVSSSSLHLLLQTWITCHSHINQLYRATQGCNLQGTGQVKRERR
jgi:hypothetical protein